MKGIYLDGSVDENARIFEAEDSPLELGRRNGREYELYMKGKEHDLYNVTVLRQPRFNSGHESAKKVSMIYTFDLLGHNREIFDTISEYLSDVGKPFAVAEVDTTSDLERSLEKEKED